MKQQKKSEKNKQWNKKWKKKIDGLIIEWNNLSFCNNDSELNDLIGEYTSFPNKLIADLWFKHQKINPFTHIYHAVHSVNNSLW